VSEKEWLFGNYGLCCEYGKAHKTKRWRKTVKEADGDSCLIGCVRTSVLVCCGLVVFAVVLNTYDYSNPAVETGSLY
jgi:hypothetical protein